MIPLPKDVEIHSVSVTLAQEPDSCDDGMGQSIELSTDDAGGGPFLILKTERWATDEAGIDALAATMRAVLRLAEGEGEVSNDGRP